MRPGLIECVPAELDPATEATFEATLAARDLSLLPQSAPRWHFLDWLGRRGWLMHGSPRADLTSFEPRTPYDLSPDNFSKQTAVFASSDGLWAMMYALVDWSRASRLLNMAMQVRQGAGWSAMHHFLSLAPRDPGGTDGRSLLGAGSVYVLPAAGFTRMPPYPWPGLGEVLEPHWACSEAVRPILRVPVTPADFPLPVRVHDAARVDALAQSDPWGFPWVG